MPLSDLQRERLRQKVKSLNLQLERGPDSDADPEQKILWLTSQIKVAVEILQSLSK